MKILNLYYSQTGNTEKIARKISLAIKNSGHEITMIEAEKKH
jgi:flavodoxin